jgi:transmembrane sensor
VTTALGTAFVVDRLPDDVTVSVIENAVTVAAPTGTRGEMPQMRLMAGQKISYGRDGLGPLGSARGNAETAWRQGRLAFENRPLGDVIATLNRYRSGTVIVLDSALLGLRVSGAFDVRDPDQVLDAIRQTLPVETLELTRYLVLLRPA